MAEGVALNTIRGVGKINIVIASEWESLAWDSFVKSHPRGSVYHLWSFRRVVGSLFGNELCYLMAFDSDDNVQGILPLVRIRSRLFGDYSVSLPYCNFGGALGTNKSVEEALMDEATRWAANKGVQHVEIRDTCVRNGTWICRSDKVRMELALPEHKDELWKGIGSKIRAQVRRPIKAGVIVEKGGEELVDKFYNVFARNMRDLGTPVYPVSFFKSVLNAIPDSTDVVVINVAEKPVAGGVLVHYGLRTEIPWAGSVREYNRIGVNMLLYWESMEIAMSRGSEWFDFGRSTMGSGAHRFKQQWGAVPSPMFWHYWIREGNVMPSLTPANPKYKAAIAMWKRLPVALTKIIGPKIVAKLP